MGLLDETPCPGHRGRIRDRRGDVPADGARRRDVAVLDRDTESAAAVAKEIGGMLVRRST